MLSSAQQKILKGIFWVLRPVARALLRSGLGYKEFSEIAKSAFVDVASSDYGIRGRPTNVSRVSVMTGLTRKEVKRVREKSPLAIFETETSRISPYSVLLRWYSDPRYRDSTGNPRELQFEGGDLSFSSLVRSAGGDIPPGAMRTELLRMGVVESRGNDALAPTSKFYSPTDLDDRLAFSLEASASRLLNTIVHNTASENENRRRVERTIYTTCLTEGDKKRVASLLQDRLREFGWSIDEVITGFEAEFFARNPDPENKGLGVGIYYFED